MFSKFIKFVFLLGFIFNSSQEKKTLLNDFLDNYTLRDSYEDTLYFKTKNIFSIKIFKKPEKKEEEVSKIIDKLPYTTISYDENNIKTNSWKEKINKKIPLPLMDDFNVGENKIELKKRKIEMYY